MKKFVIVQDAHNNYRSKNLLDYDYLCTRFSVDFIDLTALIGNWEFLREIETLRIRVFKPSSFDEFKEIIEQYTADDIVYFGVRITTKSIGLYKAVSSTGCRLISFVYTGIPTDLPIQSKSRYLKLFKRSFWYRLPSKVYKRIVTSIKAKQLNSLLKGTRRFDVVFYCGEADRMRVTNYDYHTRFCGCNYFDYEMAKKIGDEMTGDYIVFIDQYEPFHPDIKLLGLIASTPDVYYSQMNVFFNAIEVKYKCKVVIAAHPKSEEYRRKDYFEGRKVYFGKTAELVKNAKGVIFHSSTAISYAIMFNKPLMPVYTRQMKEKRTWGYVQQSGFERFFNLKAIETSEVADVEFREVEPEIRGKYMFSYLTTPESKDRRNGETITKAIKNE
jgi:hypothetical protein